MHIYWFLLSISIFGRKNTNTWKIVPNSLRKHYKMLIIMLLAPKKLNRTCPGTMFSLNRIYLKMYLSFCFVVAAAINNAHNSHFHSKYVILNGKWNAYNQKHKTRMLLISLGNIDPFSCISFVSNSSDHWAGNYKCRTLQVEKPSCCRRVLHET